MSLGFVLGYSKSMKKLQEPKYNTKIVKTNNSEILMAVILPMVSEEYTPKKMDV